jgi:calpain-15
LPGHAYALIAAKEHEGIKLVNLRNPWGKFEWTGDWSDSSSLWTEDLKEAFGATLDGEDGSFWMTFGDFTSTFFSLDVCRSQNWDEIRVRGRFIRYNDVRDQNTDVVVSKWFYALEIPVKTHVIVGLHQEDQRICNTALRRPYIDAGIAILKRDVEEGTTLHSYS